MTTTPRPRKLADPLLGAWPGLHLAILLFVLAGLFGKWLTLHPLYIVLGRVGFATVALGLFLAVTRAWPPRVQPADRARLALCGGVLAFHWFAFFQSIQVASVAVGLLAFATAPVFTALLEPLWFREAFSPRSLVAALLTTIGIAFIPPTWGFSHATALGVLWGIGAGGSFALLSLLNRGLRTNYNSALLAFWQDGVAMLVLLPAFLFLPIVFDGRDIALLLVLGVVCTALAHGLFIHALLSIKASTATLVSNLEPVYGIVLAALFLGEVPGQRTLAGGAVVLATVFWFTRYPGQERGRP